MSQQRGCSAVQIVFRFALQAGMIPLTGTTSEGHMKEDLAAYDIELSQVDVEAIENIALS
jgi:diketogulonate reductase-like aldo/keto reductase